ncbi:MAG: asparagine synthase C-terminal domain-containing protein [Candidatus Woesearchaeota archaeon]
MPSKEKHSENKNKEKNENKEEKIKDKSNEIYLEQNMLVKQEEWFSRIESIKKSVCNEIKNTGYLEENKAIEKLKECIENAVKKRADKKNSVLYSGGIDSTIIAWTLKKLDFDFVCCSVGMKNSPDVEKAVEYSEKLGFEIKTRIVTENELLETIREVVKIINSYDKMKVGVGSVAFLATKLSLALGIKNVFSGLGAEELFAGYQRHLKALNEKVDVNEECWNGLKTMHERDLTRDFRISSCLGINLRTPFLDKQVIRTAMRIKQELKISMKEKKIILRKLGLKIGLPEEICLRPKKAAQYGSLFESAIIRMAKSNGYKNEIEFLKSIYEKSF